MSILCNLGFHSYVETAEHMNWRMSTDKSIEWTKRYSGWYEFRRCKRCEDIQQRQIATWYGRISFITEWRKMDKESKRFLEMYKHFNKNL